MTGWFVNPFSPTIRLRSELAIEHLQSAGIAIEIWEKEGLDVAAASEFVGI